MLGFWVALCICVILDGVLFWYAASLMTSTNNKQVACGRTFVIISLLLGLAIVMCGTFADKVAYHPEPECTCECRECESNVK